MPPVTPRAINAMSVFDLDNLAAKDFLLRDRDLLVARLARLGALQELARPLACQDDEFKPVCLWCSFHVVPFKADLKVGLYDPGLPGRPACPPQPRRAGR